MLVLEDITYAHPGMAEPYSFTLTAEAGAVTAVSGASGSGKSTLLDLIAGFLQPISGRMTMDGTDLLALPPEARPLSILFQSDAVFEHLSATENVALGLKVGERAARDAAVAQALSEVGLGHLDGRSAARLSGGEKQRVALARTLLRNKPLLLLDEPFSALDDTTRRAIRDLVGRLTREKGWTTLMVSHHGEDVAALASRHYRLENGRLVEGK
jgi:thiamine transport system ATP-binding protein